MINGDEIIGRLVSDTKKGVVVQDPLIVEETMDPQSGLSNIVLTSYVPFGKQKDVSFEKFHVIAVIPVEDGIERYYENSLKYNKLFVSDRIKNQLDQVNVMMEHKMDIEAQQANLNAIDLDDPKNHDKRDRLIAVNLGHVVKGNKTIN